MHLSESETFSRKLPSQFVSQTLTATKPLIQLDSFWSLNVYDEYKSVLSKETSANLTLLLAFTALDSDWQHRYGSQVTWNSLGLLISLVHSSRHRLSLCAWSLLFTWNSNTNSIKRNEAQNGPPVNIVTVTQPTQLKIRWTRQLGYT